MLNPSDTYSAYGRYKFGGLKAKDFFVHGGEPADFAGLIDTLLLLAN